MTSLFSSRRMFSDMVMQLIVKVMGTVTLFSLLAQDADLMRMQAAWPRCWPDFSMQSHANPRRTIEFFYSSIHMLKIVIIFSMLVFLFVVYDVLRKKALFAKPGGALFIVKIERQRKRRACMLLFAGALVFTGAGVWQCMEPSERPDGVLFHLANFMLGKYGPAVMFFALGIGCFFASMKRLPAFFQRSVQAGR